MSAENAGWRLFVAVPVPDETRAALFAWAARWRRGADNWRWVSPAAVHLTLRFYGATDPALVPALSADLAALAAGHPRHGLQAAGWGVFPSASRPRVLWAGLAGDPAPLVALADGVERSARAHGFAAEERRFHPHLTLARAAERGRPALPGAPDAHEPVFGPVPVDEIVLYRSHLGAGGARYEALHRAPLGAA